MKGQRCLSVVNSTAVRSAIQHAEFHRSTRPAAFSSRLHRQQKLCCRSIVALLWGSQRDNRQVLLDDALRVGEGARLGDDGLIGLLDLGDLARASAAGLTDGGLPAATLRSEDGRATDDGSYSMQRME